MMTRRHFSAGFTLIELMIVVAVVGILAAIAYPSYTDSVLKGRRTQARTAILDLLQQQERYMTQNNTYLSFTNVAGTTSPAAVPFKVYTGDTGTNPAYWLSADTCDATQNINECVKVTATPTATNDTAVAALSMTTNGVKSCSGTAATSNPTLCWP
jgi:type IV pilus assembly protein PilE